MKRHHLLRAWLGPVVLAVVAGVLATAPGAGQSAQAPEHRGDVYVIERPEALIILNTYQQQLTAAERRTFKAFVPMVIVNEHTYLSDGFTPCMTVVIDGKTLFIQRDRSGDIVGLQRAGFHRAYRSVFLLSDSIRIVGPAMRLASIDRSASYALERGEILQRSFRQGDRTFVRRWSKTPPYGWVSLSDRDRSWEVVSRGPVATAMSTKLVMKVEEKVRQVNETLGNLFDFFNAETGARRAPPRWRVSSVPGGLVCVIEADSLRSRFPKSTRQLMKEIESVLIGTMYTVRGSAGRIEVVHPAGNG